MSVQSTALSDHERRKGARNERARGPPEDAQRPVMTPKEVAEDLDCNLKTVYEGIRQKQIPAIRVGKLWFVPRRAYQQLVRGEAQ
jgi:excisionase family DNA binding protein